MTTLRSEGLWAFWAGHRLPRSAVWSSCLWNRYFLPCPVAVWCGTPATAPSRSQFCSLSSQAVMTWSAARSCPSSFQGLSQLSTVQWHLTCQSQESAWVPAWNFWIPQLPQSSRFQLRAPSPIEKPYPWWENLSATWVRLFATPCQ